MSKYLKYAFNTKQTPQTQPIPGKRQARNSAGGYVFSLDVFARLQRFLILGTEGGSYYAKERKLTAENVDAVREAIRQDGPRVVNAVVDVSDRGRAPKNGPALFVLALCMAQGDAATRQAAMAALPKVARTGTHLFEWADYVDGMRGWGKGLRRAVSNWYLEKPVGTLALHAIKYRARCGWSHADLLRKCHVQSKEQNLTAATDVRNTVFSYMVDGWANVSAEPHPVEPLQVIWAAERARDADEKELVRLITDYRLPMEAVPTEKRTRAVYEALVPEGGITWLIRNLGNLSKAGVLDTGRHDPVFQTVVKRLTDREQLVKGRVHPLQLLVAAKTYGAGHGDRGKAAWSVNQRIVDALEEAFYLAFEAIEPTDKRWLLAIDVSGSMSWPSSQIAGLSGVFARDAAACMAMATYRTENRSTICAFSSGSYKLPRCGGIGSGMHEVALSPKMRLDTVVKTINAIPAGGTDCALPMLWAKEKGLKVDVFVVYTDSETWAGTIHPMQALAQYRDKMGIDAKLIVCGMVSNGFSIADPSDPGALDIVGFDTAAPTVMNEFVLGRV